MKRSDDYEELKEKIAYLEKRNMNLEDDLRTTKAFTIVSEYGNGKKLSSPLSRTSRTLSNKIEDDNDNSE